MHCDAAGHAAAATLAPAQGQHTAIDGSPARKGHSPSNPANCVAVVALRCCCPCAGVGNRGSQAGFGRNAAGPSRPPLRRWHAALQQAAGGAGAQLEQQEEELEGQVEAQRGDKCQGAKEQAVHLWREAAAGRQEGHI